jgi:trichothecene 3-O-acetyltransferase
MATERVLIRPNIPLGSGFVKVSPLDQYMVRVILPMMCVFQVDQPALRPAILRNLQIGLANTIDEMNFLAANIVPESEERDSIQLEYDAENPGVWFYEKEDPEVQYETLAARNFPFSEMSVSRFVPEPRGHSNKSPVITVQATFITGGLIVTFSGHHAIMDAQGLGTFAQTWANHVNAESEGRLLLAEERLSEDALDGFSTFGGRSNRPISDFQTYWAAKDRPYEAAQAEIFQTAISGDHDRLKQLVPLSHWAMSKEALNALKEEAMPPSTADPAVTENAIISALIWRHVSRARQLSSCGAKSSSLLTSVNVRRRMDPQLAVEYPGNAIVLARATATAAEFDSNSGESLYRLAHKVVGSIDWWTPDQIWGLTGAIEASADVGNKMIPPLDYDLLVTSPSRLGDVLGKSVWGTELGKVKALRWAFPAFMDGFVVMLPGVHGGQEIMLWTDPAVSRQLKEDAQWTRWVEQLG